MKTLEPWNIHIDILTYVSMLIDGPGVTNETFS